MSLNQIWNFLFNQTLKKNKTLNTWYNTRGNSFNCANKSKINTRRWIVAMYCTLKMMQEHHSHTYSTATSDTLKGDRQTPLITGRNTHIIITHRRLLCKVRDDITSHYNCLKFRLNNYWFNNLQIFRSFFSSRGQEWRRRRKTVIKKMSHNVMR